MLKQLFFGISLCSLFLLHGVENSIVPLMEHYERLENVPSTKMSTSQRDEIEEALKRLDHKVRYVSYNVLFDLHDHEQEETNRWKNRLPRVAELLQEMDADILSVQELYPNQFSDLYPFLEDTFSFFGEKNSDGELNGIFYKKERFELIESDSYGMGHFFTLFSDRLNKVQLKDRLSNCTFAVFNTHFTFSKVEKRAAQAQFVAETLAPIAKQMPVIFSGDLNTFPNRPDLEKLPFLDGDYIHKILRKSGLQEAKEISLLGHVGPLSTFSNIGNDPTPFKGTGTPGVFLDHVYVSEGITVLLHGVQGGTVSGHYPSDHLPVIVDLLFD